MLVLLRVMWQAAPVLTLAYVVVCLAAATLTAGFVLASGAAIGRIPAAVAGGVGSAALRTVEVAAALMAALFVAQQVCAGVQTELTSTLGRRVEARMQTRLFRALSRPRTLAHLDDPAVRELIARASTIGTARYGVSAALGFGTASVNAVLLGVWMTALVATFRWWLAVVLLVMWLVIRVRVHREALAYWAVLGFQTSGSQRSVYFRDLGLTPPAAKEVRVFGLGDWVVDRFREHWSGSSGAESARRTKTHLRFAFVIPVVALYGVAFLFAVRAIRNAEIDLRGFAVVVQSLGGMAVLGNSWRDDVVITWGAATVPPVWELERFMERLGTGAPAVYDAATPTERLAFDDVSFAYPGSRPVLRDFTLDIPVGRSLALVGSNGAGKTTLVKGQ